MNWRRRFGSFAVLGAWLATPAAAHRVDEYLQATRLSIDTERVDLEIDLTAGSALASEGQVYAQRVLDSVVLKVDGRPVPINLVETSFPQFQDMSLGVGTIRLRATAKVPAASAGHHQISFLNTHRTESSVYLVNALVPANPRIRRADQRRDRAQLGLTLDYQVVGDATPAHSFILLAGLVMAATCLFLRRGHSLTHGTRQP